MNMTKQTYKPIYLQTMNHEITVQEHLTDDEFHQIMEIVGKALDRSSNKGFIKGDTENLELSIKAFIPNN